MEIKDVCSKRLLEKMVAKKRMMKEMRCWQFCEFVTFFGMVSENVTNMTRTQRLLKWPLTIGDRSLGHVAWMTWLLGCTKDVWMFLQTRSSHCHGSLSVPPQEIRPYLRGPGQIITTNPPRSPKKWWFNKGIFPKIPETFRFRNYTTICPPRGY